MINKLIWNDIKKNKLSSCAAVFFMAASVMFAVLAVILFSDLAGAIDGLMDKAEVPDYMQMHAGELNEADIACFAERHAQMNSMMASSKRFLVNETDYEAVKADGNAEEEYLIEFVLHDGTDTNSFGTSYAAEGLYADGPVITRPLIRMMNAMSDGRRRSCRRWKLCFRCRSGKRVRGSMCSSAW